MHSEFVYRSQIKLLLPCPFNIQTLETVMKQTIQVRSKSGIKYIKRVLEHQGQYIGPIFCHYKGKKVEVFSDFSGQWYINVD